MKKKFLYGNNIEKMCKYCAFGEFDRQDNIVLCRKKKKNRLPEQKCIRFRYDPILRKPKSTPVVATVTKEELDLNL